MNRLNALGTLALLLSARPLHAQALASPFGTVSQRIDSTTITVEYYRPSARGRTIFGKLVRWGDLWTPGANWATTLEVSHDVLVEGRPLSQGKYSVWMIPAQRPDSWTVVFNRAAKRFHVVKPSPTEDQLRVRVAADSASSLEMVTFTFPSVTRTGATLAFQWAGTVVPIHIDITSTRPAIAAAHVASSYTGVYQLRDGADSTGPFARYEVIDRGGTLWVRTTAAAVEPGLDTEFDLVPAGGDRFHPRQYKYGKLIGDELDEMIVFRLDGARATGFEIRGIAEDKVLARGRLTPPA